MRAPQREVFVMLQQSFGEVKLFVALLEMSEYLQYSPGSFLVPFLSLFLILHFVCCSILRRFQAPPSQDRKKRVPERNRRKTFLQTAVSKFIVAKLMQQTLVLLPRGKLNL